MEVGAVKQAFNNEIILLKKNLSQAKINVIHKLTRKAKTLTQKKQAPEAVIEKFRRKAESAVKEVLIIKKLKARDIGKFIVTHTGQLQDFLNRQVDNDRACARLLLHKALQEKYKLIRRRFKDVPIKDLFMSRQERLKLKKEQRELQKNKKKGKGNKVVNTEGDWDVEDVKMGVKKEFGRKVDDSDVTDEDESGNDDGNENSNDDQDEIEQESDSGVSDKPTFLQGSGEDSEGDEDDDVNNDKKTDIGKFVKLSTDKTQGKPKLQTEKIKNIEVNKPKLNNVKSLKNEKIGHTIKMIEQEIIKRQEKKQKDSDKNKNLNDVKSLKTEKVGHKIKIIEQEIIKRQEKKQKDSHKNKNLNEKLLQRKFKKGTNEAPVQENKVVDPFFITSTGENYLSVAEPRQPDEVKEIHKQGNRQVRRAAMFGRVPKFKPRQDNFGQDNRFNRGKGRDNRFNKEEDYNTYARKSDNRFENQNGSQRNRFQNRPERDENRNFKEKSDFKRKFGDESTKPEKLHPSWEAKKRQSGILPFQGKKIVFSES